MSGTRSINAPGVLFSLLVLLSVCRPLNAQRTGEWRCWPATWQTVNVAEAPRQVFAVANGTLYSYGKEDSHVTVYSRQTGLHDTDIRWIGYHAGAKMLLIIYRNGNIDLMSDEGLYNLPYLKNTTAIRDKEIYDVYFHNENAYVAAKFGIMVIRLDRKEIAETYKLDMAVYGVCIQGETLFASTENGLLKASLNDNLPDVHNWHTQPLPDGLDAKNIRQICEFEGKLCFRINSSGVYSLEPGGEVKTLLKHGSLTGMKRIAGWLATHTSSALYLFESLSRYETVSPGTLNDVSALTDDGACWLASDVNGLTGIRRKAANDYETVVSGLNLGGPKRNLAGFQKFHNGKLWIAGGGRSKTVRYYNPGTLMTLQNGEWFNFDETAVNRKVGFTCLDYNTVAIDPDDETHFFVGTCGEGVLEFKDNAFVQLYDTENSALQTTVPGNQHYIRVQGFSYDRDKNLWMTNSEVNNGIVVRKADGTWISLYYPGITQAYFVDQILITSKGHKWVNVPHSSASPGILVFDDRGTLDDASDDAANYFPSFKSASGGVVDASAYYCMVEDLKGEIWIGTNKGPIICSVPARAIENPDNLYCTQIIREDETDSEQRYYFLNGEEVHAIAVDGGNRKWIGTTGSGVFLVSPDGSETLLHFNTDNSPLYSNNILSIAIDHQTGEVFFGTDKGLISYRGEAVAAGEHYSDVYAFPNPVRLAVDDQVIITGLVADSNVKITDLSGNLIYQGRSAGGQLAWNCRNRSGHRVATGIYLVLASAPGARESAVAKIAIVQ
ncbi:MAG: hypothetical protein LBR86_06365 [Tannerella sp.]|jgi:sugar lactone lactonase YvrE|nr:hypothetical protein [Tannerella sp.]